MPGPNRKRMLIAIGAATLCLTGVAVTGVATGLGASAEETPTARELLDACDQTTDYCEFHPEGPPELFTGDRHPVGEPVFNCTKDLQRATVNWSDTDTESNTFGVSLRAEYGFSEAFKVSIETKYERTWESSRTEGQSTNVDIKPGEKGWVVRGAKMQRVKGRYELHFEDRFYDHYIWYLPFEATGPEPGAAGVIIQRTAPMTEQERKDNCN
jgi:hypothetical protein